MLIKISFLGEEVKYPKFIIPYRSKFRKIWNIFIIALIIYEIWWYPFGCTFIFGEPWSIGFLVFEIISLFIFGLDIAINFRTTYSNENNEEIVDPKMTSKKYMKSKLFIVDVITVLPLPEILLLILMISDDQWKVYSLIVLIRMLRVIKISAYLENRVVGIILKLILLIIISLIVV